MDNTTQMELLLNKPYFVIDFLPRKVLQTSQGHFYEVEHTTDIKNSLSKFYELQDFFAGFFIVASSERETEYNDKINAYI